MTDETAIDLIGVVTRHVIPLLLAGGVFATAVLFWFDERARRQRRSIRAASLCGCDECRRDPGIAKLRAVNSARMLDDQMESIWRRNRRRFEGQLAGADVGTQLVGEIEQYLASEGDRS